MFVTKRFIVLVLAGVLPAALSLVPGVGAYAFAGYNLLLAILFAVDFSITPNPRTFRIRREMEQKLSLSVWNRISLVAENPVLFSFRICVRDSIPDTFLSDAEILSFKLGPREVKSVPYKVKPLKRGEYVFDGIHLRMDGVLGLCVRSAALPVTDRIRVYPNLRDMRNHHLLMVQKRRLLTGFQKIRQMGTGTEFESIREYNPGDDYRHINWIVTARQGQLHVNRYEPEKNQYVIVMMDTSRVMQEEIKGVSRFDYAVNAVFIVAETAMNHGDNIGLMAFDSEIRRVVKPGKGTTHFQRLAENLYNIECKETSADYEKAFSALQKMQNRRSLILLFTDPYNFEHAREIAAAWRNYAPRHKVLVLSIKNPGLHSEAEKRVKQNWDVFAKSAALKLIDDRKRTFSILEASGIPALESNPDSFTLDAVNRYIEMKMRLR